MLQHSRQRWEFVCGVELDLRTAEVSDSDSRISLEAVIKAP